jgi:DNA-binding PadR family transcriptional regulator
MALDHILLGLLARQPASGYDLERRITRELSPVFRAELSQIYPTLGRLARQGLVSARTLVPVRGPASRRYRLTAAGRRELDAWLRSPALAPAFRDESLCRLILSGAEPKRVRRGVITEYERALKAELARLRAAAPPGRGGDTAFEAALRCLEALRRWTRQLAR